MAEVVVPCVRALLTAARANAGDETSAREARSAA
jgi:hypothetical protein